MDIDASSYSLSTPLAFVSELPKTCLPTWTIDELPEPRKAGLRNLAGFIGPGIVMCGIQLAGGEWLLGAEITARYGGSLMWLATVGSACGATVWGLPSQFTIWLRERIRG